MNIKAIAAAALLAPAAAFAQTAVDAGQIAQYQGAAEAFVAENPAVDSFYDAGYIAVVGGTVPEGAILNAIPDNELFYTSINDEQYIVDENGTIIAVVR